MRFAPKTVDCPSDAVGNGDTDRLDSRRAWENSQRGYPFYRYSKSYLPTHGVFRKGNGCILYVFAGTTCVRYAEAKRTAGAMQLSAAAAQPACGTPRQSFFVLVGLRSFAGTTCVRYAEAKIPGKEISDLPIGGTTCVRYATKASKKTGLARLFGYIRIFVRKPTVFSIWLL